MTTHYDPARPVAPISSPPDPLPRRKGNGLAVTSLVIGVVSLLLCWVPVINNGVFLLALVGLGFGVPAWIGARRGRRSGGGLAVGGVVLAVLSVIGVLASQAVYVSILDEVDRAVSEAGTDIDAGLDEFEADLDTATGGATERVLGELLDVELGDLVVDDADGFMTSSLAATVTNTSDEARSFDFLVEGVGGDGSRLAEDTGYVETLGAGQSTQVELFVFIDEATADSLQSATFRVAAASAY